MLIRDAVAVISDYLSENGIGLLDIQETTLERMVELFGDREVYDVTPHDLHAPLAELGFDLKSYRESLADWEDVHEHDEPVWVSADAEGGPHPVLAEFVEAGFGNGRVLDIGCGDGENSRFLASRGADVLAVDISPNLIKRGRNAESRNFEFRQTNFFDLEAPKGSFDCILDSWCVHHVPVYLLTPYVNKIASLLKPGGQHMVSAHAIQSLELTVMTFDALLGNIAKVLLHAAPGNTEHFFTERGIRELYEPKFDIKEIRMYHDAHIFMEGHFSYIARMKLR